MKHAQIILLILLAPAVPYASAAGGGAVSPAREAFDSVYGADVQRVKAGRDARAAAELATRMLAAAKESKSQPAFQAVLCEKAYELTATYPSTQPLAIEAMVLLAACAPEKALQSADAIADLRQRLFDAARGEERAKAGDALLDAILVVADSRGRAGAAADAAAAYKRAQTIATAIKSDRRPAIEAKAKELAQAARTGQEVEALKKQLEANPSDAAVCEKLVRLYLVCLDDPATAAKHLDGVQDAALLKFVPAAAKGIEAAPEVACAEIGNWYAGLAETATAAGSKAAMLARAKAYYTRFLELHMTDDLERMKVSATLKKTEADLEKLSVSSPKPSPQGKWIDLLAPVDLKKDVVQGVWRREEAAVTTTSKETDKDPACVLLPVVPRGDYELEVRFVRKSGSGAVEILLPVGPTAVAVSLSRSFGQASGLELVDGKRPPDNATSVKPGTLENNHEYTLVCKVGVNGSNARIGVTLDGKPYISWQGPVTALSLHANLRWPHPECPGLGAFHDPLVFRSARLRMLSGEAKPLRP